MAITPSTLVISAFLSLTSFVIELVNLVSASFLAEVSVVNAETSALLERSMFATFSVTTETPSTLTSVTLQAVSPTALILASNALSASVLAEISAFSASVDEVSVFNFVIWS